MALSTLSGTCHYILSADLNVLVRCRIDRLFPAALAEELIGNDPLDIQVQLILDGEVARSAHSQQAAFDPSPENGAFRQLHVVFAIKVCDLPVASHLAVWLRTPLQHSTLGTPSQREFCGALPLFNQRGVLLQGAQLLPLVEVKASTPLARSADAWADYEREVVLSSARQEVQNAFRTLQMVEFHRRGCLPQSTTIPGFEGSEEHYERSAMEVLEAAGEPWLSVHLPVFQHFAVFSEPQYDSALEGPTAPVAALQLPQSEVSGRKVDALAAGGSGETGGAGPAGTGEHIAEGAEWLLAGLRPGAAAGRSQQGRSFKFADYDVQHDHPAVLKSLRLQRSQQASRVKDRDARPDAEEMRRINDIISRPKRQISAEEKLLLFRFRFSLPEKPGALTKFLHAVDWKDLEERQQVTELLGKWSLVDIDDALELLGKEFRGISEVRRHAVSRLEGASDDDLKLYLLQLVQALRYEPIVHDAVEETGVLHSPRTKQTNRSGSHQTMSNLSASAALVAEAGSQGLGGAPKCALTWFLICRAVRCRTLATLFHWYLLAEADDRERGAIFDRVRQQFLEALAETADGREIKKMIERQVAFRQQVLWCLKQAKQSKRDRLDKKIEKFRQALQENAHPPDLELKLNLAGGLDVGVPLPVDPSVTLLRVLPEKSSLTKSAVLACEVCHTGDVNGERRVKKIMVKEGDDLRQDQLVLQLIILMDSILKKYGLDLQLTPYQVIALSTVDGIIEFVPDAQNLSAILRDHKDDIQQFFRANHPVHTKVEAAEPASTWGPHNSYGFKPEVLDNFIRSNAGYCVLTYILGIGDRHLDNLMLTRDGHLFHIDFGFILGKDPKPFPPPMRISKEMVEGMGGFNSPGYQSFKSKCCQAFKILRRHTKLIINLLYLMTDSGIKDISGDPQFAILKVEQKFQSSLDDEQAEEYFLNLIDESVGSLAPVVMEKLHKLSMALQQ